MKDLPQRPVDIATIEHELKELWEQMTEVSAEEDQQAIMRACVANLVVFNSAGENAAGVGAIIAEVTNQHPSRVTVLLPRPDSSEPSLNAMVTAQCYPSERGRKQICCEQIVIEATGSDINHLPSLVRPLLIPDLPVFLWWRDVPDFESDLFAEFVEGSDRVILDSAGLPNGEEGLRALAVLMNETIQTTAYSDLSWCRLTPWRVLVAGFFDAPRCRADLARLDRVEIHCAERDLASRSIPAQGLLLIAWIASRLNWQATTKRGWLDERTCDWELEAENRTVSVHVEISEGGTSGLDSVRLAAGDGLPAQWVASMAENGKHLVGHAGMEGRCEGERIIRLDDDDEAHLAGGELEILGHDRVYEQTLRWLAGD